MKGVIAHRQELIIKQNFQTLSTIYMFILSFLDFNQLHTCLQIWQTST